MRTIAVTAFLGATLAVFWGPVSTLLQLSLANELYSHIPLVPIVSAWLLVRERERVFARVASPWGPGSGLVVVGLALYGLGQHQGAGLSQNDQLSVAMLAAVITVLGGFVGCYGGRALRAALFPVAFLALVIPIPDAAVDRAVLWLQIGSAEATAVLFELVGVPVLRTGFIFALPGVTIEVAEECSGIRSSIAMVVTSLLAGHVFLRSPWAKAALTLATLPLLVVKNAIRIVTLTLLAVYVDTGFLTGSLHRGGGIVFFAVSLLLLLALLELLRRAEQRTEGGEGTGDGRIHA